MNYDARHCERDQQQQPRYDVAGQGEGIREWGEDDQHVPRSGWLWEHVLRRSALKSEWSFHSLGLSLFPYTQE